MSVGRIAILLVALLAFFVSITLSEYVLKYQLSKYSRTILKLDECEPDVVTATTYEELALKRDSDKLEALGVVRRNGVAFLEDLLSQAQAAALRAYIMQENRNPSRGRTGIISEENREHLTFGLDESPIVAESVHSIVTSQPLRGILEEMLGTDAALMELASITAYFGASAQRWHKDTPPQPRNVPVYSLFVPLQETSRQMGATSLCAGSMKCDLSKEDPNLISVCDGWNKTIYAEVQAGTGALMNSNTYHRGSEHSCPSCPARVMFYLSFAVPPTSAQYRKPPLGATYAIRKDMLGRTLAQIIDKSYSIWSPIDVWSRSRGWNWFEMALVKLASYQEWMGYDEEDLAQEAQRLWTIAVCCLVLYAIVAEIDLFQMGRTTKKQQQPGAVKKDYRDGNKAKVS